MRERKSLGMKNFIFKSSVESKDLEKIIQEFRLTQKQINELRFDHNKIMKQLAICTKGIALLVTVPEPDLESEQDITQDNRDLD